MLRLPSFGEIFRPVPENDDQWENAESSEEDFCDSGPPMPSRRPTSVSIDANSPPQRRPHAPPSDFAGMFAALAAGDVRTKPSYTDCWITNAPDGLRPLASYMTGHGSVLVGMSDDGEVEYNLTPREYAYPDGLNAVVMDVIEGIRDVYREEGGPLDEDSVTAVARSLLEDRSAEVENVCGSAGVDEVISDICSIAYRHSVGAGIFDVLLSDPHIEDVYIDAPCDRNRIHVTMNGISGLNSHMRCRTNLMAEDREVWNLVNILKRESGLRFSHSNPVLETDFGAHDARVTVVGYPLSPNGNAVAIRKRSQRPWTLSRLVANGTVDPRTAGVLSFLVNSRATILICGARGSGKSSLLSALMFEFPLSQRILTIEDTMELPGSSMRRLGYKVQSILVDERMGGEQLSRSDEALRVSLRMGESAIVLGEVRGEEARTLYQSMRAGRAGSAIMGTIHGDSAESVYKRVVYDIGIPPEAFTATDVLVTLGTVRDRRTGHLIRRVNELVTTAETPGEFVDASDGDRLFSSPVMRRALQSSQMTRREAAKDIRARSMLRAHLAELGASDERFLGPEWILAANDAVSTMGRDSTAESVLEDFKRRTTEASHGD